MKRIYIIILCFLVGLAVKAQTYINPILGGDHPDPTVVRDGNDYFMTHSSFEYLPGLTIYHSRDLVNWEPIGSALDKYLGSVWAPDICKFKGKYYIYFTTSDGHDNFHNYVVTADNPAGPWSESVDLYVGGWIDPCHVYDEATGKRWMFLSGGHRIQLSADGMSTIGKLEKVYSGWKIPDDWVVEGFALEGPKIKKIGDYYYWLNAEGGTAGPATTHMTVVARSKSVDGSWENSPLNPLIHTYSGMETWWSKGHASLIDTPDGHWYAVYHAYDKERLNQGRQTLMEPVEITSDGWLKATTGADVDKPLPMPFKETVQHSDIADRLPLFRIGKEWKGTLGFKPDDFTVKDSALVIHSEGGTSPSPSGNGKVLLFTAPYRNYEISARFEIDGDVESGLIFYYDDAHFAGFGCTPEVKNCWRRGEKRGKGKHGLGNIVWIKLRYVGNVLTGYLSDDGKNWTLQCWGQEMSGYQHNILGGFMSLLPGVYSYGKGDVTITDFEENVF